MSNKRLVKSPFDTDFTVALATQSSDFSWHHQPLPRIFTLQCHCPRDNAMAAEGSTPLGMTKEGEAKAGAGSFPLESYNSPGWVEGHPAEGRHVVAQTTADGSGVVVYQAFNPTIGRYAARNGKFVGAPGYVSRMTWVKPGFLWMMFRSNWGQARDQECILRITLHRAFFDDLLRECRTKGGDARLQWDPDHAPLPPFAKSERRAIQLGLRREWQRRLAEGEAIVQIDDISEFVAAQRPKTHDDLAGLMLPVERIYPVADEETARNLGLPDGSPVRARGGDGDVVSATGPAGAGATDGAASAGGASGAGHDAADVDGSSDAVEADKAS